ncbi:MAG: DUF4175 family protein [Rhodospirillaceae bacterium]|nr:MAG: DUF4175 family protein [Rhodospirillaceae bacterium]
MTRPSPSGVRRPARQIAVRLRLLLSWTAIVWEQIWNRLWPVASLLAAGTAVALTDVLPSLPGFVHLAVLACFIVGLCLLTARRMRGFVLPTRAEARARLEAASPVPHRPLTAVEDTLATESTPLQRLLWRRHQREARAGLDRLRNPWPSSAIARHDVFALRALAVLLLVVAVIGASGDIGVRLRRALIPSFGGGDGAVAIKLWITPPAYTNRSPLFVEVPAPKDFAAHTLEIPAGSKALVVVTGAERGVALVTKARGQAARTMPLVGLDGSEALDGKPPSAGSSRLETVLDPTERLEIRRDAHVLAAWDVKWVADRPPTVAILNPPRDAGSGRLKIDYAADDDYGIETMTAHVTRTQGSLQDNGETVDIPLAVPAFDRKNTAHTALLDLAGSPWTGLSATIQLVVTDQAGQSASSAAIQTVLPERDFTHPVAQEVAHWRKALMADPQRAAGPAQESFARLLEHPEAFGGDHIVTLALSTSMYRLSYQAPDDAIVGLPELLWQTAVRIEDGDRGAAESRMTDAERDLQDAMARNASPEEISKLVDQLQRALADYTRALLDSMPTKGVELGGIDNQGNVVSPEDIAALMEQLRQLTQMGARDVAKQMLGQIQSMLQTLRNAASGNGSNPEMQAAEQLMRDMRELTEAQSQLLNDSFTHVRQEALRERRDNGTASAKAAGAQEKLRARLGELSQQVTQMTGGSSDDLGAASKAMGDAAAALKSGAWQSGAETQGVALAKLEAGMQQASQQILRALAEKGVPGFVQMPGGPRRFAPMGPHDGLDDGEQVDVPNRPDAEGIAQRARVILEELRRRASDRERPAEEQDYLRRLMKEF